MKLLAAGLFAMIAAGSIAEEAEPIPAFGPCMTAHIGQFELDLQRARAGSFQNLAEFRDARGTDVCGVNGIILCDRSEDVQACQHELAAEQETLRQEVLATLPMVETVGDTGGWPATLYEHVRALAFGSSAGDDCAGHTPEAAAWCEAREATRRLEMAVLSYQLARDARAMPTAVELGWAEAPVPIRPRAREAKKP